MATYTGSRLVSPHSVHQFGLSHIVVSLDSAIPDSTIDATVDNAISASFDDIMADRPSHDLTDYPISGSADVDMIGEITIASANIPAQQTNESNTVLAETADHIHKNPIEIRSNAPVCHGGTSTILNCNTTSPSWDMKVTRTYIDYNDDESSKNSKRLKPSNGSRITIYQPVRKLETAERSSNVGQEKVWLEAEEALERKDSLKFTTLEQLDADTQAAVRKCRLEHKKLHEYGSSALTLETDLGHKTMGHADIPATSEPDSGVEVDDYFADDEASSPTSASTPPPPSPRFSLIGHAGKIG